MYVRAYPHYISGTRAMNPQTLTQVDSVPSSEEICDLLTDYFGFIWEKEEDGVYINENGVIMTVECQE
jgi:hypothetical protein